MREALGERIRHYRKLKKLSQEALASAMGVNKHTIWGWEDGRSWPEYDKLMSIARCLEIEPERLFETIGKAPAPPTPAEALEVLRQAIEAPAPIPEAQGFDEQEMAMLKEAAIAIREARSFSKSAKKRENHS